MRSGLSRGARFVRCCRESGKLRWLHPWRYAVCGALFTVPVLSAGSIMLLLGWIGERLARCSAATERLGDFWWDWRFGRDYDREVALRRRAWKSRLPPHGDCENCYFGGDPSCPFYRGGVHGIGEPTFCGAPDILKQETKGLLK